MPTSNTTAIRHADMPLVGVQMDVRNFTRAQEDASAAGPAAKFELVFSTGAPVRRYDWANDRYYYEQLDVSPEAINLDRLQRGAPLLNTHSAWSLEDQIGVVDQPAVSAGVGTVQAQLSRRDTVKGIVMDLEDRVIRNVSVGYVRDAMVMTFNAVTGIWTYLVTRWTPMEVSLVPIPADMDSQVRSINGKLQDAKGTDLRAYPCVLEDRSADPATQTPITAEAPAEAIRAAAQLSLENPMPQGNDNGGAPATPNPNAAAAAAASCGVMPQASARRHRRGRVGKGKLGRTLPATT